MSTPTDGPALQSRASRRKAALPSGHRSDQALRGAKSLILACPDCGASNRVPEGKLAQDPRCGRCRQALFSGQPVTLTAANFDRHAKTSDIPLLIDFWAAWCGPCRQMAPVFAAAAAQLEPEIRLGKIDTEAEQALASRFAIRSIPSLIMIRKGREIARTAGAIPLPQLLQWARTAAGA